MEKATTASRIQFRPTKKVSLGVDLGSDYVRAVLWSASKRRPVALQLTKSGQALHGPGTEFALEDWSIEANSSIRSSFVNKCAMIFNLIVEAIEAYYGYTVHVDCGRVTIVTSIDDTYYRLAIEEAAARMKHFTITRFLSGQLASVLGARAFHQYRSNEKPCSPSLKQTISLVVDIGSVASRFGIAREIPGNETRMLSSMSTKEISVNLVLDAVARAMHCDSVNSLSDSMSNLFTQVDDKPEAEKFCMQLKGSHMQDVEWFREATQGLLSKLQATLKELLDCKSLSNAHIDQLILLGAGTSLPVFSDTIFEALGGREAVGAVLAPEWSSSNDIVAMGAAIQASFDKERLIKSIDMSTSQAFLNVTRNTPSGTTSVQHSVVIGHFSTFPFVSGLIIGQGEEGSVVERITLSEELILAHGSRISCDLCEVVLDPEESKKHAKFSIIISKFDEGIRTKLSVNFVGDGDDGGETEPITSNDREFVQQLLKSSVERKKMATMKPKPSKGSIKAPKATTVASTVILEIIRATELNQAEKARRSDPFCTVSLNGELIGKTDVVKKNSNPEWNKRFYLSMPNMALGVSDRLDLDVYDHDTFGSNTFLGRVVITGDVIAEKLQNKDFGETCYPLEYRDDLNMKKQRFVHGNLYIKFLNHTFQVSPSMLDLSQHLQNSSLMKDPPGSSGHAILEEISEDESVSSDDAICCSNMDTKYRWRIISGNVPVQGFITHEL